MPLKIGDEILLKYCATHAKKIKKIMHLKKIKDEGEKNGGSKQDVEIRV